MINLSSKKLFGLVGGAYVKHAEEFKSGVTIMYKDFPLVFAYEIKRRDMDFLPPIIFITSPRYTGATVDISDEEAVFGSRIVIVEDVHYALEVLPGGTLFYLGPWYRSPWEIKVEGEILRLIGGLGDDLHLNKGLLKFSINKDKQTTIRIELISPFSGRVELLQKSMLFSIF